MGGILMRLTIAGTDRSVDIDMTVADPTVPLSELFDMAGIDLPVEGADLDGQMTVRRHDSIGSIPLRNGSTLTARSLDSPSTGSPSTGSPSTNEPFEEPKSVAEIVAISGPRSGVRRLIGPGVYDIGGCDLDPNVVVDPEFRLWVTASGTLRVTPLLDHEVRVDGEETAPEHATDSLYVRTSRTLFRVSALNDRNQRVLPVGSNGKVVLVRPARLAPTPLPTPPPAPTRPARPREPSPLSWAMILAPIPIGVLMAIFFSPFFLAFTAMSPVMTIGRWYESRRRSRKDKLREQTEITERLEEFAIALSAHQRDVAARCREDADDIGVVAERANSGAPRVWERRRGEPGFLALTVAFGRRPWNVHVTPTDLTEIEALLADRRELVEVPIECDLDSQPGLGIVGPDRWVQQACAAVVCEMTTRHGPADVALHLVTDPDRLSRWDWLKWLPHLANDSGGINMAVDKSSLHRLVREFVEADATSTRGTPYLGAEPSGPIPVFIVDAPSMLGEALVPLATACHRGLARVIVLAARADCLPAVCRTVMSTESDGTTTLIDTTVPQRLDKILPVWAEATTAEGVARALAKFHDPEGANRAADLPNRIDLNTLAGDLSNEANLVDRWSRTPTALRATLGVAEEGPLEIDLLSDGPHALIAGTTGSGKSELLRTLVASLATNYSPRDVNFVLIDFKGGGAFDACATLPHTVGVVTDLDEHLSARALRCLRAELRYREEQLRAAAVSDLRDLTVGTLPRLIIIVDEFATLAAELPEFMTSLVDVAQRGRSLGIHMVLATQRPSGVVDAKIRANTNLRLCLRVQSDADSQDVIGSRVASGIDRRTPGRGFVQFGAGELVGFQTALVSESTTLQRCGSLAIEPFSLAHAVGAGVSDATLSEDASTDLADPTVSHPSATDLSDLAVLAATARSSALKLGIASPRVPWPDPLPEGVDARHLEDPNRAGTWTAPLGLADLPDEQRVEPRFWSASDGNALIYGHDNEVTSSVVASLGYGIARSHSPAAAHLYVIDFAPGGSLSAIVPLPHVAAHVTPTDDERLLRVVQRIEGLIEHRRRAVTALGLGRIDPETDLGEPMPLILLMITGYHAVLSQAEEQGLLELAGRLERIIGDGPDLGIVTIATTSHERGFPSRLAAQVESKLILRLADPSGYSAFGFRVRDMPELSGTKAISLPSGDEMLLAQYENFEVTTQSVESDIAPQQVAVLPTQIAADQIADHATCAEGRWNIPVGVRHDNLRPAVITLQPGEHFVVTGGSGSGKTNALHLIVDAVTAIDQDARVAVVTRRPGEWRDRLGPKVTLLEPKPPGVDQDIESEIHPATPHLVVVDGLDAVGALEPTLTSMLKGHEVRFVLADRAERLRIVPQWARPLFDSRAGLALQPLPDHGDPMRVRLPIRHGQSFAVGRGYWVDAGHPSLVQTAIAKARRPAGEAPVSELISIRPTREREPESTGGRIRGHGPNSQSATQRGSDR